MPRRISNGQSLETASAAAGIFKFHLFSTFQAHRETDSGQNETVNARRETGSVHRETFNVRREGDNAQNGTFNGRRATDNGRSTTGDVCRTSHSVRRETDIGHFTADDVRREVANVRRENALLTPAPSSFGEEQRYLILECKVGIFEDVIHEDNEFAHDGGEGNLGGFAGSAQALIKLFELTVGMGGNECGHVECPSDGRTATADAAASMPLAAFTRMRSQTGQGRCLATIELA
jgi:hypothetical protein